MNTDQIQIETFLRDGETKHLDQLLSKYQKYILNICLKYTQDIDEAKDFLQDICIKVFEKIKMYSFESKFTTWLYALARNYCLDQVIKKNRIAKNLDEYSKSFYLNQLLSLEEEEEKNYNVKHVLNVLKEEESVLLRLKYIERKSIDEIAQLTGLKESCIKMRLSRAKLKAKSNLALVQPSTY